MGLVGLEPLRGDPAKAGAGVNLQSLDLLLFVGRICGSVFSFASSYPGTGQRFCHEEGLTLELKGHHAPENDVFN